MTFTKYMKAREADRNREQPPLHHPSSSYVCVRQPQDVSDHGSAQLTVLYSS